MKNRVFAVSLRVEIRDDGNAVPDWEDEMYKAIKDWVYNSSYACDVDVKDVTEV